MKLLGISRSERFSPNAADRDQAIFLLVSEQLRNADQVVETVSEDELELTSFDADAIFSMARDESVLQRLTSLEMDDVRIVNSAAAVLGNKRSRQVRLFREAGIPQPETCLPDACNASPQLPFPFWIKADASAQFSTDVAYVDSSDALNAALRAMNAANGSTIIAQTHVEGALVKFYGVRGTDFFRFYFSAADERLSKFGLERHNSAVVPMDFSGHELHKVADKAAALLGLMVYGGDCVVRADGSFLIIDFNDWPSFAPCRTEAAEAIVQAVIGDEQCD